MRSDPVTSSFSKISIFICQLGLRLAFLSDTLERKANPRKKLLAHWRWWPLASIPLRMGLNPSRTALFLFVSFFNIRQRDNTRHRYNTSTFFLIFRICARYIWKNKVGLITKQAHVFLTSTSQYFYLPASVDQLQWLIYACYGENLTRTCHKFQ